MRTSGAVTHFTSRLAPDVRNHYRVGPGGEKEFPLSIIAFNNTLPLHLLLSLVLYTPLHFHLTLKRQRCPDLVARLVELVRVKREAEPKRRASIELRTVRERRNTAIVDLGLGEAERVELVLRRELETASLASLHVVAGLRAHLHGPVHLLVVARGDDSQVLRGVDVGSVAGSCVAEAETVLRDRGFLEIVAGLTADKEALMSRDDVNDGVDIAARLRVVDEGAGMHIGVLEGEGEFLRGGRGFARVPEVLQVDLGAGGDDVGELDFAVEERGGGPRLRDGDAWAPDIRQRDFLLCAFAIGEAIDREVEAGSQGCG